MVQKLINERENIEDKLFWTIDDIAYHVGYGKTWLEDNLLHDPRIRQHQRQPKCRGKRIWLRKPTEQAIQEIIMNEWN